MADDLRFFVPTVEEARGLREVAPVDREIASINRIQRDLALEEALRPLVLQQETIPGLPVSEWATGLARDYIETGSIPEGRRSVLRESPRRGESWLHGDRGFTPEEMGNVEAILSRIHADRAAGQAAREAEIEAVRSRPPVRIIPTGTAPLTGREERIRRQREAASAEALRRQKLNEEVQMMSRTPLTLERQLAALDLLRD